jgi:hypothetical protein
MRLILKNDPNAQFVMVGPDSDLLDYLTGKGVVGLIAPTSPNSNRRSQYRVINREKYVESRRCKAATPAAAIMLATFVLKTDYNNGLVGKSFVAIDTNTELLDFANDEKWAFDSESGAENDVVATWEKARTTAFATWIDEWRKGEEKEGKSNKKFKKGVERMKKIHDYNMDWLSKVTYPFMHARIKLLLGYDVDENDLINKKDVVVKVVQDFIGGRQKVMAQSLEEGNNRGYSFPNRASHSRSILSLAQKGTDNVTTNRSRSARRSSRSHRDGG